MSDHDFTTLTLPIALFEKVRDAGKGLEVMGSPKVREKSATVMLTRAQYAKWQKAAARVHVSIPEWPAQRESTRQVSVRMNAADLADIENIRQVLAAETPWREPTMVDAIRHAIRETAAAI